MKKSLFLSFAVLVLAAGATPALAQAFGGGIAVFDAADANHDDRVSRAEFAAAREKQFDRLDRNDDGAVSRDDFSRLIRFRRQTGERLNQWIAAADGNRDGKVTREEMKASPMPVFDRADTDNDGAVSQAELAVVRARGK